MNCHDFEAIACELVSDRLMDAAQRQKALTHSGSCARCAARLADERALSGGLRYVANIANQEAPARVEAALLASFRQQHIAAPAVPRPRNVTRRWLYAAASIAAIALIAALIASGTRNPRQAAPQTAGVSAPTVSDEPHQSPEQKASPGIDKKEMAVNATGRREKPVDRHRNAGRSKPQTEALNKSAENGEIATEFIPLMNREALAQMDGGQVIRVELPRSAMMSFGLPMDMERASERVKADVVVGNDGLARAIRFVR